MRKLLVILLAATLAACSPTRYLKKATAVIYNIPQIQILETQPIGGHPIDPMQYTEFFMKSITEALESKGIKAFVMQNTPSKLTSPNELIVEVGMAHVEDFRQMEDAPESGLKMMLMGGFGSLDKDGNSINKSLHHEIRMSNEEIAEIIKNDPNADPIKALLTKGANILAEQIATDAIEHLKHNAKKR